jgi:short-subunit dehydrogenase involved in D-alanine esterification of teichoic acids
MNLRSQLQQSGHSNIRVVEIAPPTVATDLHRERKDPHDNSKDKNPSALTVEEFMSEVVEAWKADKECIGAGPSQKIVERWYGEFGSDYEKAEGKK